jgi:hypothetical protein
MKNIMEQQKPQEPKKQTVFIAQNLIRESVMLDAHGNEIDPATKQIIRKDEDK